MTTQTQKNRYSVTGYQSIILDESTDISLAGIAEKFANRMARKQYGKSGYCRTIQQGAHAQDGTLAEFSAFIGYSSGRNETSGHNVNFTLFIEKI